MPGGLEIGGRHIFMKTIMWLRVRTEWCLKGSGKATETEERQSGQWHPSRHGLALLHSSRNTEDGPTAPQMEAYTVPDPLAHASHKKGTRAFIHSSSPEMLQYLGCDNFVTSFPAAPAQLAPLLFSQRRVDRRTKHKALSFPGPNPLQHRDVASR